MEYDRNSNLGVNEEIDHLQVQYNGDHDSSFDPISNLARPKIHFWSHYLQKQFDRFHYISKRPFPEYCKPRKK